MPLRTTVLVLNFNGREHLPACLDSLGRLDVFVPGSPGVPRDPTQPDEVWLVDNASTDGSLEFVRSRFPWVRMVESTENLGFSRAYNRAAAMAGSRFVAFLNNDARVEPGWLSALLHTQQTHPEAGFVAGRIMDWAGARLDFVGADTFFTGHAWQRGLGEEAGKRDFAEGPLLFGCAGSLLAEREAFLGIGGFDPDYFSFFEDVDLGWRAALLGIPTWFAPDSVVRHKRHGSWSARPQLWVRLLAERNALFTAFKNFASERMGVVLLADAALTFLRGWWSGVRCDPRGSALTGDAIAHFLALAELHSHLDALRKRRAQVQAARVRRDEEILSLFGALASPPTALGPEYRDALARWTALAGITAGAFGGPWPAATNAAAEAAALALAGLCASPLGEAFPTGPFLEADWEHDWEFPLSDRIARALSGAHATLEKFTAAGMVLDSLAVLSDELHRASGLHLQHRSTTPAVRRPGGPSRGAGDDRPFVSVIVRTKDRPRELRRALASVAAQRYPNLEVVVVSDGGDDPGPVLEEFGSSFPVVVVRHAESAGRSAAAQAGLEAAAGEFVNFLDDDDELLPNHLDTLTAAVREHGARVAYADVECVEENVDTADGYRRPAGPILGGEFDASSLHFENMIPIMAVLMDRELALTAGGFDPALAYFEDWDLWLRLAARTRFHHCPVVTAHYHVGPPNALGRGIAGPHRWAPLAVLFDRHRAQVRGADWARFYRRRLEPARDRVAELERELEARDRRIADLNRTLAVVERSRGWRLVQFARRLLGRR